MQKILFALLYQAVSTLIGSINFNSLAKLCQDLDPTKTLTNAEKHELVASAAKSLGLTFSANFLDAIVKLVLEWSRSHPVKS